MKVTNCIRQEEGTHLFGLEASEEEVRILINIALEDLVSVGEILEEELEQPPFREPSVNFATVRDISSEVGYPLFDIECRFSDGQKFAAIQVDGAFPELAARISKCLSEGILNDNT